VRSILPSMPPSSGAEFYDQPEVEAEYFAPWEPFESPVETLEAPAFWEAVGDVRGLRVLDLGCGDGSLGSDLLERGATSYDGVDASTAMVARAGQRHGPSAITEQRLEALDLPADHFDLVVSLRVLHYVKDVVPVLRHARDALVPGGRLIFTVEHPVITSNESREPGAKRGAWTVDNYFDTSHREVVFLGAPVVKHHRTIEQYLAAVHDAGFAFHALSECAPRPESFGHRQDEYQRRQRIPLFLMMVAQRPA
jgi:SAM-dependent methyltransferase